LMSIRQHADGGEPTVIADPDGDVSNTFREIAKTIVKAVAESDTSGPVISIVDD